ncbi:hypothetical protein [Paraflavitalea speifideaquila]|uniref:hypothetical protein n=1 Tax=Paraflavitalea speifideaquila TaxID=3076558 RepID=UPI0028E581B3|nr:hypothetical protein [Paraflavitalea speifideiaquila]
MKRYLLPCLLLLVVFMFSCGSNTRITGSWIDPDIKGKPKENARVFIASLSRYIEVRTKLESALAAQAAQRGIKAIKSTEFFRQPFMKNCLPGRHCWTRSKNRVLMPSLR